MTNEELNTRIENGWTPVARPGTGGTMWEEIEPGTLRVAAPAEHGIAFVQVVNNTIVATWPGGAVRWLAPDSLEVRSA